MKQETFHAAIHKAFLEGIQWSMQTPPTSLVDAQGRTIPFDPFKAVVNAASDYADRITRVHSPVLQGNEDENVSSDPD